MKINGQNCMFVVVNKRGILSYPLIKTVGLELISNI
jgi:hypothetical protein